MDLPSYTKGYRAGQKKAKLAYNRALASAMKDEFERQVFLAVLPQLLAKPWQTEGAQWTRREQFIQGALGFAEAASKRFIFAVPEIKDDQP